MAEMYAVEVVAKQDRIVTLDVRMAHPDAIPPSADPGSAFMMLCESATPSSVLGNEVKADAYVEPAWLVKHTRGYVDDVKVTSRKKATAKTRASARLAVAVTDAAWIEHLAVGQTWSSTAFVPTVFVEQDYAACKPADPKKARAKLVAATPKPAQASATASTPVTGDAVIMVPLAAWGDVTGFAENGAPAEIPVFAYPLDAYVEVNRIEKPTIDEVRALHGQLVRRHSRSSRNPKPDDGFIIARTDETTAYFLTVDFNAYAIGGVFGINPVSALGVKRGSHRRKKLDEVLTATAKEAIARAGKPSVAKAKAKPAAKPAKTAAGKGTAKRRA